MDTEHNAQISFVIIISELFFLINILCKMKIEYGVTAIRFIHATKLCILDQRRHLTHRYTHIHAGTHTHIDTDTGTQTETNTAFCDIIYCHFL